MGRPTAAALALGLAAAALGAGCGKSKEAQLFDQRHATCDSLVSGKLTVQQADEQFSFHPVGGSCPDPSSPFQPLPGDICPYQSLPNGADVCSVVWEWLANDDSLCSPFGCVYGCEARIVVPAGQSDPSGDVVCGARWFHGQP